MKTVSRLGFAMGVLLGGLYLSATNPAYAEDAPFLIRPSYPDPGDGPETAYIIFDLISEKDGLVINNIIVNKGHCFARNLDKVASGAASFPITLNYSESEQYATGQSPDLWATICLNILEIEVQTNEGTWSFRPK
jgi:hypothetical protein